MDAATRAGIKSTRDSLTVSYHEAEYSIKQLETEIATLVNHLQTATLTCNFTDAMTLTKFLYFNWENYWKTSPTRKEDFARTIKDIYQKLLKRAELAEQVFKKRSAAKDLSIRLGEDTASHEPPIATAAANAVAYTEYRRIFLESALETSWGETYLVEFSGTDGKKSTKS